jgi:hypothetical protein
MYSPNFNDPRVQARIYHALGFAIGTMSYTKPHQWSTRYIDKYFGIQSNNLSGYLREVLLITHNNHWSIDQHKCKEYLLNPLGVDYLRAVLQKETTQTYSEYITANSQRVKKNNNSNLYPIVLQVRDAAFDRQAVMNWAKREFGSELQTLKFTYKDQSDRLWHPIQNIKSEYRDELFAEQGLPYHYDIVACAPTLILQHAQAQGMDEYPFALSKYLKDRDVIRKELAQLADVPVEIIKVLINAMFCGARLGNNRDFALSELLKHDQARILVLQQNEFIQQLKADIKMCWNAIAPTMSRVSVVSAKTNKERLKPITSKQKWIRYFNLERCVLDAVSSYLKQTDNKCFLIHDGWVTQNKINKAELIKYVSETTGYKIKIDKQISKIAKESKL